MIIITMVKHFQRINSSPLMLVKIKSLREIFWFVKYFHLILFFVIKMLNILKINKK